MSAYFLALRISRRLVAQERGAALHAFCEIDRELAPRSHTGRFGAASWSTARALIGGQKTKILFRFYPSVKTLFESKNYLGIEGLEPSRSKEPTNFHSPLASGLSLYHKNRGPTLRRPHPMAKGPVGPLGQGTLMAKSRSAG